MAQLEFGALSGVVMTSVVACRKNLSQGSDRGAEYLGLLLSYAPN
jgi:hypothetical protein